MKIVYEFFPVVVFFIAFKLYDIYTATAVLIAASFVALLAIYAHYRKIEKKDWITFAILCLFGGLTIMLHDDLFLKWKVSVINWGFALICIGTRVFSKKTFMEHLMGDKINLPHPVWQRLNWMWAGYFLFIGILNIIVAYCFSTEVWVNFKLFGLLGLTILFVVLQSLYLSRHLR